MLTIMTEGEAAADALTGAIVAGTIEPQTGAAAQHRTAEVRDVPKLRCRADRVVLRSLRSVGARPSKHHLDRARHTPSVVHFDGKLWRTLPELGFAPVGSLDGISKASGRNSSHRWRCICSACS